ncbi:HET-domain-containing protein [Lojkania enalia]|uniref:HET-domain-containing protein n=1 Tax=Lojkania enalia TaxID=147567 RepID=A0A9P4KD85_9PLEO|nr:HET-domain-containing protein [Didymosphaeria enalia]
MSGICRGCQGLFSAWQRNKNLLSRDPNTPFVRTGPSSTPVSWMTDALDISFCPICTDLWGAMESFAQGRNISENFELEFWTWRTGQTGLYTQFQARGENVKIEFYASASNKHGLDYWSRKRDVIPDCGSDEAFTLVKGWIDDCKTKHQNCNNLVGPQAESKLPTRVLDVGYLGAATNVKLLVTNGIQAPYTALSHCWGREHLSNTTKATLRERLQNISMATLPQAFQDAVTITRKLGIRYLWIDSLCIVQDDPNDWDIEAARMADVYGGAFLTIANSWADGSTKPILRSYPKNGPELLDPFITRMNRVRVRRAINHEGPPDPLSTRSWTLQERLLSRRILHYGVEEMRFECRAGLRCECSDYQIPIRPRNKPSIGPFALSFETLDWDDRLRVWFDIVEEYSNRNLTVKSDKLPAIHGVVQRFSSLGFGFDPFFGGMWEGGLLPSLLWTTAYQVGSDEFPTGQKHRPAYRAPTWSWASIDAQTWYPDDLLYVMRTAYRRCEIYDTKAIPLGSAGAVKSAEVRIRSYIIPVSLELPEGDGKRNDHQQQWRMIAGEEGCWFTPDAPLYDCDTVEQLQKKEVLAPMQIQKPEKKKHNWKKMFSKKSKRVMTETNDQAPDENPDQRILCLLLAHGSNSYVTRLPDTGSEIRSVGNRYKGIGLAVMPSKKCVDSVQYRRNPNGGELRSKDLSIESAPTEVCEMIAEEFATMASNLNLTMAPGGYPKAINDDQVD